MLPKGVRNMKKETEKRKNSYELIFPNDNQGELIEGAVNLVNHFNAAGLMLPVTPEHYTTLTKKGTLVVAKSVSGEVIGTAAYTQFYERDIWEFGGWAVAEDHQHRGIGMKLMKELFSEVPHFQTIAFGNKNSGPIFESFYARIIEDHSILPKKAFELCAGCPMKPKVGCCDKIYNLSPVVERLGMPDISWMTPRQFERLVYGIGEGQWGTFKGLGKDPKDWY